MGGAIRINDHEQRLTGHQIRKETILDVVGRTLDDALRLETINAYSSLGDFTEAKERLAQFYSKEKRKGTENA